MFVCGIDKKNNRLQSVQVLGTYTCLQEPCTFFCQIISVEPLAKKTVCPLHAITWILKGGPKCPLSLSSRTCSCLCTSKQLFWHYIDVRKIFVRSGGKFFSIPTTSRVWTPYSVSKAFSNLFLVWSSSLRGQNWDIYIYIYMQHMLGFMPIFKR